MRRADPSCDQWGRNSAEQSSVESGLRQRAGQTSAGSQQQSYRNRLRHLCLFGGGYFPDHRGGATACLSVAYCFRSAVRGAENLRRALQFVPATLLQFRRNRSRRQLRRCFAEIDSDCPGRSLPYARVSESLVTDAGGIVQVRTFPLISTSLVCGRTTFLPANELCA